MNMQMIAPANKTYFEIKLFYSDPYKANNPSK